MYQIKGEEKSYHIYMYSMRLVFTSSLAVRKSLSKSDGLNSKKLIETFEET